MTTLPTTYDELVDLIADADISRRHRPAAVRFESWADAHPSGVSTEVSQAELLSAAATMWKLAGDADRAEILLRRAVEDGSPARLPPVAALAEILEESGRHEDARSLIAGLRPKDVRDSDGLLFTA